MEAFKKPMDKQKSLGFKFQSKLGGASQWKLNPKESLFSPGTSTGTLPTSSRLNQWQTKQSPESIKTQIDDNSESDVASQHSSLPDASPLDTVRHAERAFRSLIQLVHEDEKQLESTKQDISKLKKQLFTEKEGLVQMQSSLKTLMGDLGQE